MEGGALGAEVRLRRLVSVVFWRLSTLPGLRNVPETCALRLPLPSELLLLLEDPAALDAKVDEAVQVLKQHNAIPDGAVVREKGQQAA